MLKRIALVVWWIGALCMTGAAIAIPGGLLAGDDAKQGILMGLAIGGVFAVFGVFWWTIAFILGGTFRRPPPLS